MTDVQRELGLSPGEVRELIASRRLPAFRILGQWRIERELLERMIDELYEESADAACALALDAANVPPAAVPAAPAPDEQEATEQEAAEQETADAVLRIPRQPRGDLLEDLTEQQQRIFGLVGQGLSNAEIASALTVEISTVKSHVSRMLQRCALRDREQLIVLAWRSGFMARSDYGLKEVSS
jgi:DNA-binding NarL/FixJ family response regulator